MTNALIVTEHTLAVIAQIQGEAENLFDHTMRPRWTSNGESREPEPAELRLIRYGYAHALADVETIATVRWQAQQIEEDKATTSP